MSAEANASPRSAGKRSSIVFYPASPWIVRSPRNASSATCALKLSVNFRLLRPMLDIPSSVGIYLISLSSFLGPAQGSAPPKCFGTYTTVDKSYNEWVKCGGKPHSMNATYMGANSIVAEPSIPLNNRATLRPTDNLLISSAFAEPTILGPSSRLTTQIA